MLVLTRRVLTDDSSALPRGEIVLLCPGGGQLSVKLLATSARRVRIGVEARDRRSFAVRSKMQTDCMLWASNSRFLTTRK